MENRDAEEHRTIGYIVGRLEGLATKEYVQEAINKQTVHIDSKFGELQLGINSLNEKHSRIIGAGELIKLALPTIISIATLAILVLSLIAA